MDVEQPADKPKALVREIGIIVLGVLLALGAQEAVKSWQMRQDVATFRETIDQEIAGNLWVYQVRLGQSDCINRRLDQLDRWLAAAADGRPRALGDTERPFSYSVYQAAWDSRDQQVFAALPAQKRQKYAENYSEIANYESNRARERDVWLAFLPFEVKASLSVEDRRLLHGAMQTGRQLNRVIGMNMRNSLATGRELGITPKAPPNVSAEEKARYQRCPALAEVEA